ncbi:serine protease gd [Drosophila innubila]|uniref:serine protease gd n=1 Tax=Drosophila innubila TaxID=198719 RepID=UPI00148E0A28|nr:serine protease gd [Drosophila innubila]
MKVNITTILLICFEQFTKTIAQGMPISPCPKIFQYRFDGNEWFGIIAVRNPEVQGLQIRVLLSMRGKPTTNYLGEIELLTRGQFTAHAPVLYKIRFPKHNFPPKLVLISTNNQVICFGSADHSTFMTQIQLEHTRKLTFIPDIKSSSLIEPTMQIESGKAVGKETPSKHEFGSKPLPHIQFKKNPFHSMMETCGKIDKSFDFRLPKRRQRQITSTPDLSSEGNTSANDELRISPDDIRKFPVFVSPDDYGNDSGGNVLDEVDVDENNSVDSIIFIDGQSTSSSNSLPSITRGAWPWLAAIYVNNVTSLDFQCCGTLISARVVISSAHCFQMFNQRYTANELLVFLGRHNLKNWNEEGSLAAPVDGIYIHSDYNRHISDYDADIAVLILKDEVRFNTFIQPVCLWSGSTKTENIVGEHGIVIGWSFDRSNSTTLSQAAPNTFASSSDAESEISNSKPKVLKAPIVSNEVCFKSNEDFRNLSSNRTFCAGILVDSSVLRQGWPGATSIYTGISGAGLMIMKNNRWMLRGTVSATLPVVPRRSHIDDSGPCCSKQYIIYADVAKFIDWIMAFII